MHRFRSLHHFASMLALLQLACFQRFVAIRATETDEGIAFEVREIAAGLDRGQAYELLDLTVMRRDCDRDCTLWFIVRDTSRATDAKLATAEIAYGVEPGGMVIRTAARPLVTGRYSVSATVQQYDAGGEFIRSLSLNGRFSITEDPSGKLKVSRNSKGGS